jgi:hypothetical protein
MRIIFICCLLLFTFTLVRAQESTREPADGWTIEQRCVAEPTTPPDNWSFDGTILTEDEAGIHGIRSDWETAHVLAFTNVVSPGNRLLDGSLSPDMQWYAAAEGDTSCNGTCMNYSAEIEQLHIFNLSGAYPRQYTSLSWDLLYNAYHTGYDAPRITWLDNETFLYPFTVRENPADWGTTELRSINPFTNIISQWTNSVDPTPVGSYVSPDLTRDFIIEWLEGERHVYLVNSATQQNLFEFDTAFITLSAFNIWSPNSQFFISAKWLDEDHAQLELRDKNGNFISVITYLAHRNLFYPPQVTENFAWSPDSRYMTLNIGQLAADGNYLTDNTAYVIDLQEQKIIDLCLDPMYYPIWSPDSEQLAIYNHSDQVTIMGLLDINSLEYYSAAYNIAFPIGWRADD